MASTRNSNLAVTDNVEPRPDAEESTDLPVENTAFTQLHTELESESSFDEEPIREGNHRALTTLSLQNWEFTRALGINLALTLMLFVSFDWVTEMWCNFYEAAFRALGLPGTVDGLLIEWGDYLSWTLPQITLPAGPPDSLTYGAAALVTIALLAIAFMLPRAKFHYSIVCYGLCALQGSSLIFFALWPDRFPYTVSNYFEGMIRANVVFIMFLPVVIVTTFSIFDLSRLKKLAFQLMVISYFIVEVPVLLLWHVWLIHHFSLLFLPMLFLCFGIPFQVLMFLCLYSWGMSWD